MPAALWVSFAQLIIEFQFFAESCRNHQNIAARPMKITEHPQD
jgi:hypothetical protein